MPKDVSETGATGVQEWSEGRSAPDLSVPSADRVSCTTCYMCACRCGIKVHIKDGRIRYIEGNRDHPVNKGVLCAKGSAGLMNHYSPARLRKPLKRTGPRGSGQYEEIEWEEALSTATAWLGAIRNSDPRKLAFFTGRDQSQALTGWWASQFGTPNYAAHGGFCSVNMAAAGLYTVGGSFWEFGEADWEHTRYFLMFGVAEDHDSNPIKIGLGKLKTRGDAKFVSVNPVRTGYSAIADEWIGIRPGTDGLLILALIQELLRAGKIDEEYLGRYTNAAWLVVQAPGAADDGLFARDEAGQPMVFDEILNAVAPPHRPDAKPSLAGKVTLPDGRSAVPAFHLVAQRCLDPQYAPDAVAAETGIEAGVIRRIAAELAHAAFEQTVTIEQPWTDWTGRQHDRMVGRPVAMHAMRGISAHSNGFHTCRAIHVLQMILGAVDTPGAFRYKPPFPRPIPPGIKPAGRADQVQPGKPMPGPPLGFPTSPQDLLLDPDGTPRRLDKAYSWEAPIAAHGLMHQVIHNAWAGDPYPIDTLFMFMANMSWNSSMNTAGTIKMLTDKDPATGEYKIPRIIYSDAYASEMVAYADLILPDTTYLERWDCISLLDRPICDAEGAADSIRQPVVLPDRDVRPFQDVLIEIGARLGLPALVKEDGSPRYPGGYADYLVHHERKPGVGMLAGFRGTAGDKQGIGEINERQLDAYVANGCFWRTEVPAGARYFKHANREYLEWATGLGLIDKAEPIVLQFYSEVLQRFRLAAQGHGDVRPPEEHRERIATYFDPLPLWYMPFEEASVDRDAFPMHAVTQRPMAMYHSWGSQNAWLRQIHGDNALYMNRTTATRLGIADGDWVSVTSHHGRIKVRARLMEGVNPHTVWTWNAIGKRAGAWNLAPGAGESQQGFLLNHVISELLPPREGQARYFNADPVTGQAAWYDLRVRIERIGAGEGVSEPQFPALPLPPHLPRRPRRLRRGGDVSAGGR
ncbi:molybdopterin oxidoreductase family protein [Reyranella sp.]|uniref:molybdopterin oxidoreductase family protein n=1 Tax=Reyranella sp. TaxID=1929291 RepID=UPI003BAAEE32